MVWLAPAEVAPADREVRPKVRAMPAAKLRERRFRVLADGAPIDAQGIGHQQAGAAERRVARGNGSTTTPRMASIPPMGPSRAMEIS